jgi:hypothetical protein
MHGFQDTTVITDGPNPVILIGGLIILCVLYFWGKAHLGKKFQKIEEVMVEQGFVPSQPSYSSPSSPQESFLPVGRNEEVASVPVPAEQKSVILPEWAKSPPADLRRTLPFCKKRAFSVPIGWKKQTGCHTVALVGESYHILITGQSRAGKDNLTLNMLLALALQYGANKVQFCVIDGKGLDFCGFEGKAHTWGLALKPEEIAGIMSALTEERSRRGEILRNAKVTKWENYEGFDIPLLVVYVSELSLLEDAVGKSPLTAWLNSELAAGAAFGMRYIIATQTASNFSTRWRSQISLYLASFQPSQSQDWPNAGLTTKEIEENGGIPPSKLPPPPEGAGVFTCIQGRTIHMVRAGLLDDKQRESILAGLPASSNGNPIPQKRKEEDRRVAIVAALLAKDPTLSITSIAKELYPGTSGTGDYHKTAKRLMKDAVEIARVESYALQSLEEREA